MPGIRRSVLVVDTDLAGRSLLMADLRTAGWEVLVAGSANEAIEVLQTRAVGAAVVDLGLPDMNGLTCLHQLRQLRPALPVIVLAAQAALETAVESMRAGACDFLAKPLSSQAVRAKLDALVPEAAGQPVRLGRCVTIEPTLATTFCQARQLAGMSGPLVLCGAPGTGRKTLAWGLHEIRISHSPITVLDLSTCSPEQARASLVRLSDLPTDGLTIADAQCLKPPEQERLAGLLKVLTQAGKAAIVTLSDHPERLARKGLLSSSLAQALAGAVLHLPLLAARRCDLPLLAEDVLAEILPQGHPAVSAAAMQALLAYDWPGNLRQLRLVLERAGRLAGADLIEQRHLPILQAVKRDPVSQGWPYGQPIDLQEVVDDVERHLINMALTQTGQNQAKAAELLGIPRTTLRDKLAKHGFLAGTRTAEI